MTTIKRFVIVFTLGILLSPFVSQAGLFSDKAFADPAYDPSALISDPLFTASGSMSENDIQAFLNSHNSGLKSTTDIEDCGPTNGSHYAFYASFYACGSRVSAARIIYDSSRAYGISPKVILATLQKEQSLVTTPNPTMAQINCAMGYYSCSGFVGFFSQVDNGTWQFKTYIELMTGKNYWGYTPASYPCKSATNLYSAGLYPGAVVTFANPGGKARTIGLSNAATAALYCYTPHVGPYSETGYSGSYNFVVNYTQWFGPTTSKADAYTLSFIDLNHNSGNVQVLGYPSIGNYGYATRINYAGYPAVAGDGSVVPLFAPNGDLSLVRLNHSSGQVEVVSYSASSGFTRLSGYSLAGYPAVAGDGKVIPRYQPNGDLSFIRMNHSSGHVEVVSYSAPSGFKQMTGYSLAGYPAIGVDAAVVPLFAPNGDLSFVRLNHGSGQVEVVSYSASSGFARLSGYALAGYPAVSGNGAVVPRYQPNGNLSFIRLNHSSGNVEVVSYGANSNFGQLSGYALTGYPAFTPTGSVIPMFVP